VSDPYRRIARFYDAVVEPPNAALREIALGMVPPADGMSVLEVGCGTGTNLDRYQRAGCRVFGVDLSPSMLAIARAKLGDRAELWLGDAADMPYQDGSFDLVTALLTLHEMPSDVRAAVMAEMVRVVAPEGRLLLIDYHSGPVRFPRGWLFKAVIVALEIGAGREHFRCYRDFMARKGLPGLVDAHGLTVEEEKSLSAGNMRALVVRA
jgi:demethylmenaquinone methyltransferase/2-methoxy-6-polyprenyl-1,4-benzoquinol methylase